MVTCFLSPAVCTSLIACKCEIWTRQSFTLTQHAHTHLDGFLPFLSITVIINNMFNSFAALSRHSVESRGVLVNCAFSCLALDESSDCID